MKELNKLESENKKVILNLRKDLEKIRTGKVTPSILDSVYVDYWGKSTQINAVSLITTDGRVIKVQAWEKDMLNKISKSIIDSNIGLNPQNNGDFLLINVPPLSEDRRKEFVKLTKAECERYKTSIRNNRRDSIKLMKSLEISKDELKGFENKTNLITDNFIKIIDSIFSNKESDIMSI
jgi:ribosome recycling factor